MEYPGGLAPPELVPRLHETLVLRVLLQVRDIVALPVVEPGLQEAEGGATGGDLQPGDDHVRPVAAAVDERVVANLKINPELLIKTLPLKVVRPS